MWCEKRSQAVVLVLLCGKVGVTESGCSLSCVSNAVV